MKLTQLTESIKHLHPDIQEHILREAPHVPVVNAPPELYPLNLGNYIDFGWEDMDSKQYMVWARALAGSGVRFPGTPWKLRATPSSVSSVELADGTEMELPDTWRRYVQVLRLELGDKALVWFGADCRGDRKPPAAVVNQEFAYDRDGWKRR